MLTCSTANSYTFEVDCGGERIIVTADPENVKAILATQFNEFGKGEEFNHDWHEFLGDSRIPVIKDLRSCLCATKSRHRHLYDRWKEVARFQATHKITIPQRSRQ